MNRDTRMYKGKSVTLLDGNKATLDGLTKTDLGSLLLFFCLFIVGICFFTGFMLLIVIGGLISLVLFPLLIIGALI